MEKNNTFEDIWNKIKSSHNIVLTLHPMPDGDSLGSACAMKYVLERDLNKSVRIVSSDEIEGILSDLPYSKEVEFGKDIDDLDLDKYDLIIGIDCATKGRLSVKIGDSLNIPSKTTIINIDHHSDNSYYGDLNYIDSKKASACNILVEMFKNLNIQFDGDLGKRLLLGICTDSNFFTFDMNSEGTMRDAVFLFDNGTNYLEDVLKPVKYKIPLKRIKTLGLYINGLRIINFKDCRFGYSLITYDNVKKLNLNDAEIRGPINDLQFIDELDFIFSLTELKDRIKGSFRSKKGIDISLFAKALGGGGHKQAAAFELDKINLEDAVKDVLEVIKEIGIHKIS